MYAQMAHFVAEKLHIRPAEILDGWCVPELLVTYGVYANQDTQKNFEEWKQLSPKERNKYPRPVEYAVFF